MKYLSAAKAAQQLDVSEKTVRRWIADGKIKTQRIADKHGDVQKFAIPESEVERLQREEYRDGTGTSGSDTDISVHTTEQQANLPDMFAMLAAIGQHEQLLASLQAEINEMKQELQAFHLQRATLAEKPAIQSFSQEQEIAQISTTEPPETPKKLGRPIGSKTPIEPPVPGAVPDYEFADKHGVNRRTFKDHINKGQVPALVVDHPSRAGEKLRWLTPVQQKAALDFWRSHGVPFLLPAGWTPLNTFAKAHNLNRNELEQLASSGIIHGVESGNWRLPTGEKVHLALTPESQHNILAFFRQGQ